MSFQDLLCFNVEPLSEIGVGEIRLNSDTMMKKTVAIETRCVHHEDLGGCRRKRRKGKRRRRSQEEEAEKDEEDEEEEERRRSYTFVPSGLFQFASLGMLLNALLVFFPPRPISTVSIPGSMQLN